MAKKAHYKTGPKKGQFKPGKSKKKATSKKKRRSKKKPVKKKRRRSVAKKKRRRRRKSAALTTLMTKAKVFGTCAVYGWAKEHGAPENMAKIPVIDSIGVDATNMLIAHAAAKYGPRFARKWFDYLAMGLAGKEGYMFGTRDFSLTGGGVTGFGGGGGSIGGALDPGDFPDDDDEDEVEPNEE